MIAAQEMCYGSLVSRGHDVRHTGTLLAGHSLGRQRMLGGGHYIFEGVLSPSREDRFRELCLDFMGETAGSVPCCSCRFGIKII